MKITIEINEEEIIKRASDEIVEEIVNGYFKSREFDYKQLRRAATDAAAKAINEDKERIVERVTERATEGTIRRAVARILTKEARWGVDAANESKELEENGND